MFFDIIACLVQSLLFPLPYFNGSEAFFSYIASSQFIKLSLLTLPMLFSERRSNVLTRTKVAKTALGFKRSVAIRTKTTKTEAVKFFLSACCTEAIDFAIWSCSLKKGYDYIFKAPRIVLLKFESTCRWIGIAMRTKTDGQGLTHRVER